MNGGGPSGFNNAPVTKTFILCSAIFTLFLGIQSHSTTKFSLSYQDVVQKGKIWKMIVSLFAFTSTPEMMFGLYLLYYFRVFERQIGSNKYSVFILFSSLVSLLLQSIVLCFFKDPTVSVTSGPYGLIFASFVPFHLDIPVSTRFRISGLHFSDKSFIYVAGLQLLLSSWKRSILPGVCGIIVGTMYRTNLFYIRRAKLPDFIASMFSRVSWPSVRSLSASTTRNSLENAPSQQVDRNYASAMVSSSMEPSDDSIAALVSMGFDQYSAMQALVEARNDVNIATNILLEVQSH